MQPAALLHDRVSDLAGQAASARLDREHHAAQLRATAVELARRVCSELDAHNLGDQFYVPAKPGETADVNNCRRYAIRTASWKEGSPLDRLKKSSRRETRVFVREHTVTRWSVLWHPQQPDMLWDTSDPPHIDCGLIWHPWHEVRLARSRTLAQFALDAETILSDVLDSQRAATSMYEQAAVQADCTLGLLADTSR